MAPALAPATAFRLCCNGAVDAWILPLGRDSGIEAHVLHADDLVTFMHGDGVPDRHLVDRQVQFVGTGQGIVTRERIGKGRDWLVQQVEDRALNRPPQRLRQGLNLLPGGGREADEAITH